MIEKLSLAIATKIKNTDPENTHSIAVMSYALKILINTFSIIMWSLIIGGILQQFVPTLIALITLLLIRFVSGGPHMSTMLGCHVASITICVTVPLIVHFVTIPTDILTTISFILMLFLAPKPDKNATMPKKFYPYLKVLSLLMVATNFVYSSEVVALVFLIQSLLLIPYRREVKTCPNHSLE